MSRDNASQRILSPRQTTQGHDSSLKNTYGATLLNGAQCFVVEEEANYRFLQHSVLHADGKFVVEPIDRSGRWVREAGTFGVAILGDGVFSANGTDADALVFRGYSQQQLVQFAINGLGIIYTGAVPRMAFITGRCEPAAPTVVKIERKPDVLAFSSPGDLPVTAMTMIYPGDCLKLECLEARGGSVRGELQVLLA